MLQAFELFPAIRAAEQDIRPKTRRQVLERGELHSVVAHHLHQTGKVLVVPQCVGRTVASAIVFGAGRKRRVVSSEIVGEGRDDMSSASLPGKAEIFVCQRIPVKAKADLYERPLFHAEAGGQAAIDLVISAGAEASL
jgi:hypothetical protein